METQKGTSLLCDSCCRGNTDSPATVFCLQCGEKLCEQCDRHHKMNKASSSHTVQSINDVKDVKEYDTLKRLTQCSVHVEKKIKYLCKDHDQLCCNECAIVKHRKCENVVSIAEEMEMASRNDSSSTEDILKELRKHAELLMLHEAMEEVKINETKETCKQALETLKKTMEASYKIIEDTITLETGRRRDTITKDISAQKNKIQKYKEELSSSIKKLETVRRVGQDVHIYLTERDMNLELETFKEKLKDLRGNATNKALVINETSSTTALQTCLKKCIAVEVKTSNTTLPACGVKGIHQTHLIKDTEYPVKLGKETLSFYDQFQRRYTTKANRKDVFGCIWLDDFLLVIRDNDVVLIDVSGKQPTLSQINLHHENLYLITKVDDRRVALGKMTRGGYKSHFNLYMYQLDPTRKVIEQKSKIATVRRNIIGVAYDAGIQSLVVLSNTGLVEFLGLNGKELESFQLNNLQLPLKSADYIKRCILFDSNSKTLYVTDNSTLIATTMKGNSVFEFKLKESESIVASPALDPEGNIYLPICAEGQSLIQMVSPKGVLIRKTNVCACAVDFMTVCFNTKMNKLAVLCNEKDKELKIFNIV